MGNRIIRYAIAAVLIFAALAKTHMLSTSPTLPVSGWLGLLETRWVQIFTVEFEILWALLLIFNPFPRLVWHGTTALFTAFAIISAARWGWLNEKSCGCFGKIDVNPLYTAVFDAVIVGMLVLFWRKTEEVRHIRVSFWNFVLSWLLIAVPLGWVMVSFRASEIATSGEIVGESKVVILNPKGWLRQRFPLLDYAETDVNLAEGSWQVVLYGADCKECRTHLEEMDRDAERVILLEIHGQKQNPIQKSFAGSRWTWGSLDSQRDWYVETPTVVTLHDGIVVDTNSY
ncbi:MAG: MauE/DoxX family redox-associated membrane protein [Thermoguttaceae bacterium]